MATKWMGNNLGTYRSPTLKQWTKAIVVSKVLLKASLWNDLISFRSNRPVNAYDHFSLPCWQVTDTLPTGCQQVTDCRPTVGQHFGLKHNTCWSTVGQQSAYCWLTVGSVSANSRPTVGQLSADCRPTVGRGRPTVNFGNYSSLLPIYIFFS